MGNISLCHDDPFIDQCGYCDNGIQGDQYCRFCGGDGITVFDLSELSTLAHNLAIGGALCRAYRQGIEWHHTVPEMRWDPGCGRAAP